MKGSRYKKVSFYITPEQERKLDDLTYEHNKRTGRRDIVRYIINEYVVILDEAQFD